MAHLRIFDAAVRTDPELSRGEDAFSFVNRAATPYWERVRTFVDDAFDCYPTIDAADLRSRFRDRDWSTHIGAWWELYLFSLFRALGADVVVHPKLPGLDARPDFRLHIDEATILVEARHVTAGLGLDEPRVGRDAWITDPLDTLSHPDFVVGVRILDRESKQPRRAAVTAGVLRWLDGLDPDTGDELQVGAFPPFTGRADGWRFELSALPVKPEARGNRRRRLVGTFPESGGGDNTATALRSALKEKAAKYGRPDGPFIIAPLLTSGFVTAQDVVSALFGSEVVTFTTGAPEQARLDRLADGFWRFGSGWRGTRVSAVLLGDAITPWTVGGALPRLWLHPAAAHPLPIDLRLPTATADPDRGLVLSENDRTGAEVFRLDSAWPGPEAPFG